MAFFICRVNLISDCRKYDKIKLAIYMIIALYLVAPFVLTIFTNIIYRNMKVEEDIAEMKAAKAN